MAALRHLRQVAQELSQPSVSNWARRPAALRALNQRLNRGFNEALNGYTDDGWSIVENDGVDDVSILVNSSPEKLLALSLSYANGFPNVSNVILCARASMLLQNVPLAVLLRFLREHWSEWADNNIDAYLAAAVKVGPCCLSGSRMGGFGNQVILPLAQTIYPVNHHLLKLNGKGSNIILKTLWQHSDAILCCCTMKVNVRT